MVDDPDAAEPEELDEPVGEDVVDEHEERFIDRFARGAVGGTLGNAMTGLEKGMGLHHAREETVEIREAGEPDEDPDDPIQVHIDPDHPENTRIVYRMQRED